MSGKNSIQVAIKVRPLLKKDKDQQVFWRVVDNSIQLIESSSEPCYFDHIFDQDANNQIIFDKMAKQIVHSAIQGFNGTIFAYGQTSSGKTYTMMGDDDNPGVMVLTANEIFRQIERAQDRQFLLRVGYIEIYNEKIYDLLNKKNQDLKIHETSTGIVSVNCEEMIIRSEDDLLNHLEKGGKERTVGETNMNERSSRSHAIFRIIIESRKIDRTEDDAVIQSVINLVDLAGSERADQTGARGTRFKEGAHINKSLLFLSNVIKQLSENEDDKYVSFRDSKLTRILQASLGGNALTAIICTIKPNAIEETQSTLSFALRAKAIKNKPQVNEIVSDATMMKRLEQEIKVLKTRLEEEQRKNESQLKVRQLEQRIKHEDLKIISCNSLNIRNREKRRRTWCPSSTNLDASTVGQPSSSLPVPSFNSHLLTGATQTSRLQIPKASIYNTPLITIRQPLDVPKTISVLPVPVDNLPEIEEEFAPAELINFEMLSPLKTPRNIEEQRTISITPKLMGCPKSTLEKVEQDLQELQSFTNLENKVDVQHEPILTLKYKVESLSQRNAELEKERREFLNLKNELELKTESINETHNKLEVLRQRNEELEKDVLNLIPLQYELERITKSLAESGNRCSELEEQLGKLTQSHKSANEKISNYEVELAELKKTNGKLEMENREAVNLEFEFKRHKYKAKLRESELLEALNEKEKEISKLEKSLNSLSAERLQNSKEELLQRSIIEDGAADEDGNICIKCVDLQRLLEENKKVTLEFEKLTLVYENLKLNYDKIEKENEASKLKITNIEEQQEKEKAECEKLLSEVQQLKEQLHDLQHNYGVLSSENSLKQEECLALTKEIEAARQEMVVLEEKFTKLEVSWQEQQQTINEIEAQYATIQTKYEQLQRQYEQLEATKDQPISDFQRLEKENVDLQAEIEDLKEKVQDAQQRLLESTTKYEEAAKSSKTANEVYSSKASKTQLENEQLRKQLEEMQTQFEALQKEYEDLSNQLIDNLQDFESLKNENLQLKENLKYFENETDNDAKAETESNEMKSLSGKLLAGCRKSILSPSRNASMLSSGVCVDEVEEKHFTDSPDNGELFNKYFELSTSFTQIELEDAKGNKKLFKSVSKNSTPKSYKMFLKNIFGIHRIRKEFDIEIENIVLQGSCNYSFQIAELSGEDKFLEIKSNDVNINGCENITTYIETLNQEILELRSINELEQQNKKSLLENTERALSEMREQITQLSTELLEKSMFVENCACKTYQQEIEILKKEKADVTIICEELQEKMNSTMNCSLQTNSTLQGVDNNLKELEKLKKRELELLESYDLQTKTLEEITQRCVDVEAELENVRELLKNQEKQYKENYNQLQLENLQKLELSENEYRQNMKKYNKEWEEKKDEYDRLIKELKRQTNELKQRVYKAEIATDYQENVAEKQTLDMAEETPSNIAPAEVEPIQSDECRLQEENIGLKLELNVAEEHLKQLNEENYAKCEEIKLLDSKLIHLEELLADANHVNVALRRENMVLLTELDDTRKDLDCIPILHEKNQLLSDEVEKLSSEYLRLKDTSDKLDFSNQEFFKKDANGGKLSKKEKKAKREEKDKLTNEIEGLNQENKQLHDALEKAEKLVEKHQQGVCHEELRQTLQTKLERLTLLEREKECLTIDLERLREEHKQMSDKLLNSDQQIEKLQNEITIREKLLQTLQGIVDNLSPMGKVNGFPSNDYENLQEKYKEMQDKLLRTEQELEELKKEGSSREEHLKTLQAEIEQLTSLEGEKKIIATYYTNLQQEHKQLQDKLVQSDQRIQELCTEDSSREVFLQSLQDKLCDMKIIEGEKKNLEDEILRLKDLQERDVKSAKIIENLKQQVNNLLENQSEIEIRLQLEKTERDDKLEHINSECNLLRADKFLLETQVRELTEEGKSLHEKCWRLKEEKTTLEEQLKCLEKEKVHELLDQIIKEKAELVSNLCMVTDKLETAQNELKENEKSTSQVRKENRQIQEDLLNLEKSLTQVIEVKTKQLEEVTSENEQAKQDNENLHKYIQTLKQDLEKENKENQDQRQKLVETKKELAKLQQEKTEQQSLLKKAQEDEDKLRKEIQLLKESISKVTEEKQQILNSAAISLQKAQNENQELQLQLKDLDDDLNKLKEDLQTKMKENSQLHANILLAKNSLTKLQEELQNIQEKHKNCLKLQEDKCKLEATLNVLKKAQTGAFTSLQDEKLQLLKTLQQYEQQIKDFKDKEGTFNNKIDSLSQQLHEMRIKTDSYEKLLLEHEEIESLLTSKISYTQTLQQEISNLNSQQETYVSKIADLSSEIDKLNSQLLQQDEEKQILEKKLTHLEETLQDEKRFLQKENVELRSSLEELKIKFNSLKSTNTQLEALNQQLQQQLNSANVKLIESNDLQEKLNRLEIQHRKMQQSLKETVEVASHCSLNLRQDVDHHKALLQKQIEKYNALSTEMTNKQHSLTDENVKLSAIIEKLTKEKVELEEKMRQTAVRNFELDLQRNSAESSAANVSSDLDASHSPKARILLERLSNVSLEDKLCSKQQKNTTTKERKNRRLSAHDERRRQSYWGAAHDKETMTEPADTSCNCLELDRKLKDCERNLLIKNSQVTALSMELKNHPLKEENAALKKRLQEEHDKFHNEIKRCKSKLYEQTIKTEKALAAAAHLTAKSTHAELLSEQKTLPSTKVVADIETQTADDLSACIQKLQGKYNDLKNICRHRYNHIKELEEKVSQKENSDGNSLSSLETVKMANKQNESLKQELAMIKEKYDTAKKVLLSRREEITYLRAQLEQNQ